MIVEWNSSGVVVEPRKIVLTASGDNQDSVAIQFVVSGTPKAYVTYNGEVGAYDPSGNPVAVATFDYTGITIWKAVTVNGTLNAGGGLLVPAYVSDYGGNFANFTPPAGQEGMIILVADTNSTSPGVRLYAYVNGAWHYVNLT